MVVIICIISIIIIISIIVIIIVIVTIALGGAPARADEAVPALLPLLLQGRREFTKGYVNII